jgi:hypothetical protein
MRILELFSGTGSVGKVAKERGWEVVSLDLDGADINCDILDWDYKEAFPVGHFNAIWASPPCHTFSNTRRSWVGRSIKYFGLDKPVTMEMLYEDMIKRGLPLVRRTEEIIDYFKPSFWIIENPQTGRMKDFLTERPFYDVDYCKYSEWGYKKRTRLWTNIEGFRPEICKRDCSNLGEDKKKHKRAIGRRKHGLSLSETYRVPPRLISSLFNAIGFDKV